MNCPLKTEETAGILLEYSAGTLDPAHAALFEKHMANCPDCGKLSLEQTAVWNALDAWEPEPVSMDFNRKLWQRIDSAGARAWYRFAGWKPAFSLAAAALLIAAGFVYDHPPAAAEVSAPEAEQVEQTLDDLQLLHQFDSVTAPDGLPGRM